MAHVPLLDRSLAALGIVLLASISTAGADDEERYAMAQLRLTTEPSLARGCARIGSAKDDSVKDLRRKIVKAGGNTAVLSFRVDDLSTIYADVYRCPGAGAPAPPPPPPPPPPPLR